MKFILGQKLGMTTIYNAEGEAVNVTLVECKENSVSGVRSEEKDGYWAVQLEYPKTAKKTTRKEFRMQEAPTLKKGDKLLVDQFEAGEKVSVSATSKGKGFQGVMKRHGFHGSPSTHGHRHDHRAPGSIGSAFPEHVLKGKKMAGRMGADRCTTINIKVTSIDKDRKMIALEGAVPGVRNGMVEIVSKNGKTDK